MPHELEFPEDIRGALADGIREELREYLKEGGIFRGRGKPISITIPKIDLPKFTGFEHIHSDGNEWDNLEQMMGRATRPAPKKPKPYRSIEEPWEPAW